MSCFDNASPVWGPSFANQPNASSPAIVFTEAYLDSYPGMLRDFGMTCAEARQQLVTLFDTYGAQGNFAVIRNGAVVPGAQPEMVIPQGGGSWVVGWGFDGNPDMLSIYAEANIPPIDNPWPAKTAGDTLQQYYTFTPNGGQQMIIQIPVTEMLLSFDFDAWWDCASGCLAPRPTPRMGMQTFSNYTYSIINSFGQVPKI